MYSIFLFLINFVNYTNSFTIVNELTNELMGNDLNYTTTTPGEIKEFYNEVSFYVLCGIIIIFILLILCICCKCKSCLCCC